MSIGIFSIVYDKKHQPIQFGRMDYDSDLQNTIPLTSDQKRHLKSGNILEIRTNRELYVLYDKKKKKKFHRILKMTVMAEND